jgi:hypothetical protein
VPTEYGTSYFGLGNRTHANEGLCRFRLDEGKTGEVRAATRTAIDSGVDSVFTWGYDACESISNIACVESERVWCASVDEVQGAQG